MPNTSSTDCTSICFITCIVDIILLFIIVIKIWFTICQIEKNKNPINAGTNKKTESTKTQVLDITKFWKIYKDTYVFPRIVYTLL